MTWKEDFMKYRREKAAQTLEDARYLFEGKRLFSAVNRIYYALFYEVSVLLQVRNLSGSVARNDYRYDSDIDILALFAGEVFFSPCLFVFVRGRIFSVFFLYFAGLFLESSNFQQNSMNFCHHTYTFISTPPIIGKTPRAFL